MLRVGVDMDGTIADFTSLAVARANKLYGLNLTLDDMYKPKTAQIVWEHMTEAQRSRYDDYRELNGEICPKGFFFEIEPFPGAIDAVKELAKHPDIEIAFITKPLNWDRSAEEKYLWLKKYFSDIPYALIMVNSMEDKRFIGIDIMIDDDLRVMESFDGAIPILIKQSYNIAEAHKYQFAVDNMIQAKDIVLEISENLGWWKEHDLR